MSNLPENSKVNLDLWDLFIGIVLLDKTDLVSKMKNQLNDF